MKNNKHEPQMKNKKDHKLEFWLVIVMLLIFAVLLIILFMLPVLANGDSGNKDKFIEFSKWILPALLGAFGAWIGAGAAYFFGKESLKESSRSTQQVLDTLKTNIEKFLIEDIHPMHLDPNFTFSPDRIVKDVLDGLNKHPEYWFVPIVKDEKLKDVIHQEAFWRYKGDRVNTFKTDNVDKVIEYIETKLTTKKEKLHGFFIIAKQTDKITVTLERMKTESATVGIICDEDRKPTHCFSWQDLRSFLLHVS